MTIITNQKPYDVFSQRLNRTGMPPDEAQYFACALDRFDARGIFLGWKQDNKVHTQYLTDVLFQLERIANRDTRETKMLLTQAADFAIVSTGAFVMLYTREGSKKLPSLSYYEKIAEQFYYSAANMEPENGLEELYERVSKNAAFRRECIAEAFIEHWEVEREITLTGITRLH